MAEEADFSRRLVADKEKQEPSAAAEAGWRHDSLERRPEVEARRERGSMLNRRPAVAAQRKAAEHLSSRSTPAPSRNGLPPGLKAGIESLSGVSMESVEVHRNSAEPARLGALAFARGGDIHLAPGQERHLPHEAWHVVQQAQGRVRPTVQMKNGIGINDNPALEGEADAMGAKALAMPSPGAEDESGTEPADTAKAGAAQLRAAPVIQLGRDKKKRLQSPRKKNKNVKKKDRGRAGMTPSEKLGDEEEWQSEDPGVSYQIIAKEGGAKTAYEEEYGSPQLFWRGDSRGPDQVFATGFTTKNERAGKVKPGANRIIWRGGGATDDILPASAVCMAKDIRGGAFFPLSGEDQYYLYAVAKTQAVNTYKAQQHVEEAATGQSDFRQDSRYDYDPEYDDDEDASAVWQFQEYAAHRIEREEMVAAFKVFRRTLVPPDFTAADPEAWPKVAMAGVQFRLQFDQLAALERITPGSLRKQMQGLAKQARAEAAQYDAFYPEKDQFLSYMGIVEPKDRGDMPQNMGEARAKTKQVRALVVQEKAMALKGSAPATLGVRSADPGFIGRAPAGVPVNDDSGLEREADVMGAKALRARQDVDEAPAHSPASSGSVPAQLARIAVGFDRVSAAANQDEDSLVTTGLANCIAVAAQDLNTGVAVMGHLNTATIIGNLAAFRAFASLLANELQRAAGVAPNPRFHVSLGSLWMGRGHETQAWWNMRHALILDCISAFGTEPTQAGGTAEFDLADREIRGSGTLIDEDATVDPPDDDPHGQAGDAIPYDRLTRTNVAGHKLTKNMSMLDKLSVAISPD